MGELRFRLVTLLPGAISLASGWLPDALGIQASSPQRLDDAYHYFHSSSGIWSSHCWWLMKQPFPYLGTSLSWLYCLALPGSGGEQAFRSATSPLPPPQIWKGGFLCSPRQKFLWIDHSYFPAFGFCSEGLSSKMLLLRSLELTMRVISHFHWWSICKWKDSLIGKWRNKMLPPRKEHKGMISEKQI